MDTIQPYTFKTGYIVSYTSQIQGRKFKEVSVPNLNV